MYMNKYEKKIYDKGFDEGRSYEFSRIMVKLESLPIFNTKEKLENFLNYLREEVKNENR